MSFQLQDAQQVVLSVAASDAAGNPVTDSGNRQWSSSDETILTLADNGDGSYTAVATGTLGTATVTVSDTEPDNPDGTPGAQFQGSLAIDVVNGPVVQITIEPGTATNKPAG